MKKFFLVGLAGLVLLLSASQSENKIDQLPTPLVPQQANLYHPYVFEGEQYASWFDGVQFDHQKFVKHYSRKDLTDYDLLQIYLYLDRLGGRIIFSQSPLLKEEEMKALYARRVLTRKLITIQSKQDLDAWKNHAIFFTNLMTENMTDKDKKRFFVFLGVGQQTLAQKTIKDDIAFSGNIRMSSTSNATKAMLYPVRVVGFYTPFRKPVAYEAFEGVEDAQLSIERLKITMSEVGLWGIKLPLGSVENANDIDEFSRQLLFYNDALEKRTGMEKVMGLKGRVIWVVDKGHEYMTDAYSVRVRPNVVFVQSTWQSYSHEWFHALQWTLEDIDHQAGTSAMKDFLLSLQHGIKHKGLTAKQWRTLMREAKQSSEAFLQQKWGMASYVTHVQTPEQALEHSFNNVSGPYNAAMVASHMYWLKRPSTYTHVSSWVGRRMIAEDMLKKAQWNDQKGIVDQTYYTNPSEWTAASFHGDMEVFMDGSRPKDASLIKMPLRTEIQAYRPMWDEFFEQIGPVWQETPHASHHQRQHQEEKTEN